MFNIDYENILGLIIYIIILFIIIGVIKFILNHFREEKKLKELSYSGIKDIDQMDGFQFEFYLKALFKQLGYKTTVTKNSNDYGADLILYKDNKKVVIQAKRYGYKKKVGINAIQQVYSAIPYYKADKAWIITNSQCSNNAIKLAEVCNVTLIDRKKLVIWINKINPNITAKQVRKSIEPKSRRCPNCKDILVKRTSKNNNDFLGCKSYPTCKHTESINARD